MSKLNEYKILKELGQGCFGKVYLVRKIIDNKLYVAKKIDLKNLDPNDGDKYIKNEKKNYGAFKSQKYSTFILLLRRKR